ncbi:MAG: leucine--tRNA ligase [Nitrosopumilaceae archaeon]|nr:leucine--tRNA ligase [Nitrosopumilaceae archaeon]
MIDWNKIEIKWRNVWNKNKIFESNVENNEKKFITVAYPYPNSPQHIGHGRTYTITDVHSRFLRMQGFNVLFPMGFHYTGTPILSISKKIQKKDQEIFDTFDKIYKIPKSKINEFTDPIKIAKYFHNEIKLGMIEMGYSIDWRREFTTIDPIYKKFVEWQFYQLHKKNLIVQGTHPVGWCPMDQNPVSQHDTVGDVEPNFTEYTIIKFSYDEYVLPAATLRPETIFGVTNIWINPKMIYKIVLVDNEKWIISSDCFYKIKFLKKNLTYLDEISGDMLLYKKAKTITKNEVIILPAEFVKNEMGTGIVMSVPAHAPYDYQALEDLKKSTKTTNIKPITIIETKNEYNTTRVKEIINKFGITDQNDSNLIIATKELYSHEFNYGILNEKAGKFAGIKIKKARDIVKSWILNNNIGSTMLELSEPIKCRCGAPCVIKILDNQWFLNYGDEKWKNQVRNCVKNMQITPTEITIEFYRVIDWLKERACARQHGLGTTLTWDKEWIIESLSDSTIYMAYYIISKYINNKSITDDNNISNLFFDYIFFGDGDLLKIAYKCKISKDILQKIRKDFLYFYPIDCRHSGRDLVPNHLTFFIMNHVAIFKEQQWPKQIVVNGSVLMYGKKMSKSMGNIIPLRDAIKKYGADPIRVSIIIISELLQDIDFDLKSIENVQIRLENILLKCSTYKELKNNKKITNEDKWLWSRLNVLIKTITELMHKIRLRDALNRILFDFDNDINWYLRRTESKHNLQNKSIYDFLSSRVLMLSPFAPHIAEEMWKELDNTETISRCKWPEPIYEYDKNSVHLEDFLKSVVSDINNIIKVTKIKPKKIIIYTCNNSKISIYKKIMSLMINNHVNNKNLLHNIISRLEKIEIKKYIKFINQSIKDISTMSIEDRKIKMELKDFDEKSILYSELKPLIRYEFDLDVEIYSESDYDKYDPGNKAKNSRPFKPAILIE